MTGGDRSSSTFDRWPIVGLRPASDPCAVVAAAQ